MIRVPSTGTLLSAVPRAKSACDLRAIGDASAMLTATATIVTATATIADASHSTLALIGAVTSMVGVAASLAAPAAGAAPDAEIVEIVGRRGDFDPGVRVGGLPALEARERRRLDVAVVAVVSERKSVGHCVWDGPGPGGVYVDDLPELQYLRERGIDVLDLRVVGPGMFSQNV